MTLHLGSKPAREHRAEHLELILNRDHPDNRDGPPALWILPARERVRESAAGWNTSQVEAQRAEIRQQRDQALRDIRLARHRIDAENAIIANRAHLLNQLQIEDQILDAPR